MGDHLLDFLSEHDLLDTNTCFQHNYHHKTTSYTGWRKDWSAGPRSKNTIPVYSQIDHVLCRNRSKSLLVNVRLYKGMSDHRLLVARIHFGKVLLCFKRPINTKLNFNTSELTSNRAMQEKYHEKLDDAMFVNCIPNNPNEDLEQLLGWNHSEFRIVNCVNPVTMMKLKICRSRGTSYVNYLTTTTCPLTEQLFDHPSTA